MNKLSVIGLDLVKTKLIRELMDLGVVEIDAQDSKLTDENWKDYITKDGDENQVSILETDLARADQALNCLEPYDKSKKPMFKTRKTVTVKEFEDAIKDSAKINQNVDYVLKQFSELNELKAEENKIRTNALSLKPWITYGIPLDTEETKYTSVMTGVVPSAADIGALRTGVDSKTDRCVIDLVYSDAEQHYLSVICMKDEKDDVYEILKQHGFNRTAFKDMKGTAAEITAAYEKELSSISKAREDVEAKLSEAVKYKESIEYLYDSLVMERDRAKALGRMLRTERTFYIEGWLPEKCRAKVENVLKTNDCWYEITEPDKEEAYPILLSNNSLVYPFEAITNLYSLPDPHNMDPTPFMAPFYFLFFGMMLGDAGYGLLMFIACFAIRRMYKLEGMMQKMINMFMYCGLSTAFWGFMFGSFFGDAIPVGASVLFGKTVEFNALWFNPINDPLKLLIFSLILGYIQILFGLGLKAYMLIRDGKALDALFDIGFWYFIFLGLPVWFLGQSVSPTLGTIGLAVIIIGVAGLILTQGRDKKNIIMRLLSGVMSLYDVTSYLSDLLSYSRILALGVSTGVIATVINTLGSLGGHNLIGIIVFVVVFIFGHVFNIAINALGSFVHASRLQYVEYFGKFYEGGGEAFDPLDEKTKYVKIVKEEI